MRDNMLISIMGHPGHYIAVDLNMEHNVGFQKVSPHSLSFIALLK